MGEVVNDPGKEPRFSGAENKAQYIEAGFAAYKSHRHRRCAPGKHDACQPGAGAVALQQQVGRHFEDRVTNKEQPGTQAIGGSANAKVGFQVAADKTDIDPVDVVDDEHHHKQGQNMTLHLGRGAGKHRRVWQTLGGIQGQTPDHCFFRDGAIMDAEIVPGLI